MGRIALYLLLALLPAILVSGENSKKKKEPAFIKLKNTRISSFSFNRMDISTEAVFYNPYRASVRLEETLIDVFVGGKKLGTILNNEEGIKLGKKGTFDIPLRINVKPGASFISLFKQSGRMLMGKNVEITFRGHVRVRAMGFVPITVRVDGTQQVNWNTLFPSQQEKQEMERSLE